MQMIWRDMDVLEARKKIIDYFVDQNGAFF